MAPVRTPFRPTLPQPLTDRWQRRLDRRRLAEQDLLAAQLAGLHRIRDLAGDARRLVDAGWLQHAWFAYRDAAGHPRTVTAHNAHELGDHPVVAACLVGAVVQAGGGLPAVHTQPVQRALDLTWHTLFAAPGERVRWCPAPPVRAARVRELTRWNDHPARQAGEVADLLRAVGAAATAEIGRHRP